MFGLKGAYFYLIAVQVTIIKFLKKIYFSTNHYNKSLRSKIPTQVYMNPNAFLLSIISPYRKRSFKISEINPSEFWKENKKRDLFSNRQAGPNEQQRSLRIKESSDRNSNRS